MEGQWGERIKSVGRFPAPQPSHRCHLEYKRKFSKYCREAFLFFDPFSFLFLSELGNGTKGARAHPCGADTIFPSLSHSFLSYLNWYNLQLREKQFWRGKRKAMLKESRNKPRFRILPVGSTTELHIWRDPIYTIVNLLQLMIALISGYNRIKWSVNKLYYIYLHCFWKSQTILFLHLCHEKDIWMLDQKAFLLLTSSHSSQPTPSSVHNSRPEMSFSSSPGKSPGFLPPILFSSTSAVPTKWQERHC